MPSFWTKLTTAALAGVATLRGTSVDATQTSLATPEFPTVGGGSYGTVTSYCAGANYTRLGPVCHPQTGEPFAIDYLTPKSDNICVNSCIDSADFKQPLENIIAGGTPCNNTNVTADLVPLTGGYDLTNHGAEGINGTCSQGYAAIGLGSNRTNTSDPQTPVNQAAKAGNDYSSQVNKCATKKFVATFLLVTSGICVGFGIFTSCKKKKDNEESLLSRRQAETPRLQ